MMHLCYRCGFQFDDKFCEHLCTNPPPALPTMPIEIIIERLLDSRIETTGDQQKPKSLVETFWLDELEKAAKNL